MTSTTGPTCREIRQLLGVYVVGAIDPAERGEVDAHLADCRDCREEVGGLAGLPALLGRVPVADVERMGADGALPDLSEPPAELLNGLLRRVASRRRHRKWRSILTLAAAVAIAAGGTAGVLEAQQPATQAPEAQDVARAANAQVASEVHYSPTPWGGTAIRVAVRGVSQGTVCKFWVANAQGKWTAAATWTMGPGYGNHWYTVSSPISAEKVHGFQITSGQRVLLTIPAT
jgi:anti-sigma factor RsiW